MDNVSIASTTYISKQLQLRKIEAPSLAEGLALLPKEVRREIRKEAKRIAQNDVFGVDHKKDNKGEPIEQGNGSASNMTQQAIDAYIANQTDPKRRSGPPEDGYADNLKRMRAQFAECQARRRAAKAAEDDDD